MAPQAPARLDRSPTPKPAPYAPGNQGTTNLAASIAPPPSTAARRPAPPTPARVTAAPQALRDARGTLELASRQLEAGNGALAARVLTEGAAELRRAAAGPAVEALTLNMEARAAAYGETAPAGLRDRAQKLVDASWKARDLSRRLAASDPEAARELDEVGLESRLQAELLFQAAANTDELLGRGVARTYQAITDASFAKAIGDSGTLHNLLTGSRDQLEADRKKMGEVFAHVEKVMERDGVSFDRAWNAMFDDHRIARQTDLPSFATAGDAAAFLRDHPVTKGLLAPMCDLAHGLSAGDGAAVDGARGSVIATLRANGQWGLAREVLDDLQARAQTPVGRERAQALNDSERREWWKQKAGELVEKDLPVLLLTGVISGGAGLGAGALASAAGWGTRAVRAAQITGELLSFVPTERVLSDVVNDRRGDWSAGGLARDYALTAAGYGLFRALGAGWRALRTPRMVRPGVADAAAVPTGRPARSLPHDDLETKLGRARENESAQLLAKRGYPVEQNPAVPGGNAPGVKHPDFRIGAELFDNYAPRGSSARNIWSEVRNKVVQAQARRIVVNLSDSKVALDALRKQFAEWPIEGLEQLLVVKDGKILELVLPKPPPPWVTPKGYPHQEQ